MESIISPYQILLGQSNGPGMRQESAETLGGWSLNWAYGMPKRAKSAKHASSIGEFNRPDLRVCDMGPRIKPAF
jgi:hypothetical protein